MKTFLAIPSIILLVGFTAILNKDLIEIRLDELNYQLGQAAEIEDAANTLSIVSKYELIKRRIENGESEVENYTFEAKMQTLTSKEQFPAGVDIDTEYNNLPLARLILRGLRFTLGKANINPVQEKEMYDLLETAYYHERRRDYSEAIKRYDQVVLAEKEIKPEVHAAILLHKGFCYSMLNEYEEAKQIFELIISKYPDTDAGILAWKLLDFLVAMEKKREMLEKEELSAFAGGKQCYFLMDYNGSITLFSEFLKREPNNPEATEARYYKGRSHEELGKIEEALTEYNMVIVLDENHKWALESNRRLFMIGEFYKEEPQIAEKARDYLAAHKDYGFISNVKDYTGSISSNYISIHIPIEQIEETVEILPLEMHTEKIEYLIPPVAEADTKKEAYSGFRPDMEGLEGDIAPEILTENLRTRIDQGRALLPKINISSARQERLRKKLAGIIKQRKRDKLKSLISYGIGVSALGGMGVALYFGNDAYNRYKEAEYTEDAVAFREQAQTCQKIAITTGIIGGIGIAAGTLFKILSPKPDQIQRQIDSIEEQIELLNRQSSD